jgi:hypothetical protein
VIAADKLEWGDLFPDGSKSNGSVEVDAYDYTDEGGKVLYQSVRFYPKRFSQRRPRRDDTCRCPQCLGGKDPDHIWNLHKTRRVPYHLPKLLAAVQAGETVYVVEGEKDVHAVERAGATATCNPMGAGKWSSEYSESLHGAVVIVVSDTDSPGRKHAQAVARSVEGVAGSIKLLEPAVGKDAHDHLSAGKTLDEFVPIKPDARAATPGESEDEPTGSGLGDVPAYPVEALPEAAQALVHFGERQGLPTALMAGAALAAMAAAIGKAVDIEVDTGWHERAILWVPLLAPRGAGKSPSLSMAFAPLREHDERPDNAPILFGDLTVEALARNLKESQGAGALDLDELSVLLRGMGEYKRSGADRGRFLALWSGSPWVFTRVGSRGKSTNDVNLRIDRPTLVICGGLQTALHELLGGEEDGLRPRWLPHLATLTSHGHVGGHTVEDLNAVTGWKFLIDKLVANRHRPTTRQPSAEARGVFRRYQDKWKDRATHRTESASTSAALIKADMQLARVELVLYEADLDRPECVEPDYVHHAAQIVDFTLDCWRALPEQGTMALSRRDEILDHGVRKVITWLEEHGGEATPRELQRAHVGGARTKSDFDALLDRYEAVYPGTVTTVMPPGGGHPRTTVRLPKRGGG